MVGRTPGEIIAVQPLRDGVIANFEMTEAMLAYFIRRALQRRSFHRFCAEGHRVRAYRSDGCGETRPWRKPHAKPA